MWQNEVHLNGSKTLSGQNLASGLSSCAIIAEMNQRISPLTIRGKGDIFVRLLAMQNIVKSYYQKMNTMLGREELLKRPKLDEEVKNTQNGSER